MLISYLRIILSLTVLISLLSSSKILQAGEENSAEKAVATVNGDIITQADLSREIEGVKQQFAQRGELLNESRLSKLRYDILEGLIDQELLYQESQKKGMKVDENLIKKEWDRIVGQFPDENAMNNALKSKSLSEAIIKRKIEKGLTIKKFVDEQIVNKIEVSTKETREFYDNNPQAFKQPEEIKASHILIKVEPGADQSQKDAALEKIKELQNKLKNGEDFASLAKEFSEGPSKTSGGDLGSFKRGQMVKPFEDAAFSMKPGEISDVVETKFGYHLIKVVEKKPETTVEFEKIEKRLEDYLRSVKTQTELKKYINELKKGAKIERFPLTQNE